MSAFALELAPVAAAPRPRLGACAALLALAACGSHSDAGGSPKVLDTTSPLVAAADDDEPDAAAPAQEHQRASRANERMDVAGGTFHAGSTPGDRGRDPLLEPAQLKVELDDFSIARLPYPNDPQKPPLTNVPRAKAAELCAADGGRLCTELEWERACRGPNGQSFAGGERWDPSCGLHPETCASGFGVLAMGGAMREWTASDVEPIEDVLLRGAAIRGTRADAADVDHRCAHRSALAAETSAGDLGFRCCYGSANSPTIASPARQPTFRKADFPGARLAGMFAAVPQLARLTDVKYFREEQAIDMVKRRAGVTAGADAGEPPPPQAELTTSPLLWSPLPGEEVLLVTGVSGKDSFVAAFLRLPDDRYRVASSFVLTNDPGPVVFVFNQNVKKKLEWATCLGCYGETGGITYRDDNRVVITQK